MKRFRLQGSECGTVLEAVRRRDITDSDAGLYLSFFWTRADRRGCCCFPEAELAARVRGTAGEAQRTLRRLEAAGLVEATRTLRDGKVWYECRLPARAAAYAVWEAEQRERGPEGDAVLALDRLFNEERHGP